MRFKRLRRRDFIRLVGGTAFTWPLVARAQQPAMPVIGILSPRSAVADAPLLTVFRQGLNETGYVEGQNVAIEYRWADGQYDRLPALAADLVHRNVSAIIAFGGNLSVPVVRAATTTIPIVFVVATDPVKLGFVASLNRPGGNITGVTTSFMESAPKRLGLLLELLPNAMTIALLVNPTFRTGNDIDEAKEVEAAARAISRRIVVLEASTESGLDAAFARVGQMRPDAVLVAVDSFFTTNANRLAALAARTAVPALFFRREFATAGGLMSYGSDLNESYRLIGIYAGRILKGVKPADLPVMQPTKFELVINLKTAKALGLTIPPMLLARADEVIE
jgi:putative ABC transport system substrate-binding protein